MSQPNLDQALKLFNQVENELADLQTKMQAIQNQLLSAQNELNLELEKPHSGLKNDKKFSTIKNINQKLFEQLHDLQKKYHAMMDQINYLHIEFAVYARLVSENWLNMSAQEEKELREYEELTKMREKAALEQAARLEELAQKLRLKPPHF